MISNLYLRNGCFSFTKHPFKNGWLSGSRWILYIKKSWKESIKQWKMHHFAGSITIKPITCWKQRFFDCHVGLLEHFGPLLEGSLKAKSPWPRSSDFKEYISQTLKAQIHPPKKCWVDEKWWKFPEIAPHGSGKFEAPLTKDNQITTFFVQIYIPEN